VVRKNGRKSPHSAPFPSLPGRAKRMSQMGRLAEGEELSSNPLRAFFNDLQTTQIAVDVDMA
jgi:hypothetical protein